MSFVDLVEKRYSVRKFSELEVEKDKIIQILEAARLAPSAVNFQPVHFIVVTDERLKDKISTTYPRDWFKEAPVVIIALGDREASWKRKDGKDHLDVDVAIAVDHLILAASELGLGTCWVCAFDAQKLQQILDLPNHLEPIALIPLGYPQAGQTTLKKRKALEEIVSWNGYKA